MCTDRFARACGRLRSGDQAVASLLDLGDMWKARFGAARVRQVSPLVKVKSMGTTTSCRAIEVIGQDWSSEAVALLV